MPQGACSGKCRKAACELGAQTVWVIAACEGMISIFTRGSDGTLQCLKQDGASVGTTAGGVSALLENAIDHQSCQQIIIVGSASDIGWMHSLLNQKVAQHISAEINYPLLPAWFKGQLDTVQLQHALERVTVH